MNGDEIGAVGCIQQRIEEWPVRDPIAPVKHALGLAGRLSDRSAVEMIASAHPLLGLERINLTFRKAG